MRPACQRMLRIFRTMARIRQAIGVRSSRVADTGSASEVRSRASNRWVGEELKSEKEAAASFKISARYCQCGIAPATGATKLGGGVFHCCSFPTSSLQQV